MELFYVNTLLRPVEQTFPSYLSANTLTLMGQMPILLSTFFLWSFTLHSKDRVEDWLIILTAATVQWFSLLDVMDGMRARRLKCGTPLGRIIDEALDQVAYACISIGLFYMMRLESPIWMFCIGFVNVPFYSMEIRHTICRHFNMIIGEIGPVEVELIVTLVLGLSGGFFGCGVYERSMADLTGFDHVLLHSC